MVTLDGDGQPIKLRGNAEHPFTRNGLCTKVNPYLEHATRPDRITTALRRVGAKGEGRFEPISLDEAFAEIAERLQHVIDTVGAEGIWPFTGTGTVGFLQSIGAGKRLFNHLGASRHEVTIKGERVPYTATVGTQPVWGDDGEAIASLLYTYYERTDVDDRINRPLMISFNGGPGSGSLWMHLGYTGPKQLRIFLRLRAMDGCRDG